MDPNANLQEQEAILDILSKPVYRYTSYDRNNLSDTLADLRYNLQEWLDDGGFEPDWSKAPHAAKHYGR